MRYRQILAALPFVLLACLPVSCGQTEKEQFVTDASITPRRTELDAADGNIFVEVKCPGKWTIELSYPSGTEEWATIDPASGTDDKADVRLRFSANDSEEDRKVTLTLKPYNGIGVSASVFQKGKSSGVVPPSPSGHYGYDVFNPGWLELPATRADDGCDVLVHDMTGKAYISEARSGVRNYSCEWCYDEHLSYWVAYPLNKSLSGNGSYEYVWGFDPCLPSNIQPDITMRSYGGLGFDGKNNWNRGHQMPRADRQTSQDAVSSTCYPTNMTPQDGSFNGNIWAKLEGAVRSWAGKSDTTYVVTGCVLTGSTTKTSSNSGFSVTVPSAYFKALLFHSMTDNKGNILTPDAVATKGYLAVGFYLPHDASISGGWYGDYMMSVSDLEKKTEIDFFVNLPGVVGADTAAKIEGEVNKFWK